MLRRKAYRQLLRWKQEKQGGRLRCFSRTPGVSARARLWKSSAEMNMHLAW